VAGRSLNSIKTGGRDWKDLSSSPEITALVATGRGETKERVAVPPRGRAAGREALTKNTKTVGRINPFIGDEVRVGEFWP